MMKVEVDHFGVIHKQVTKRDQHHRTPLYTSKGLLRQQASCHVWCWTNALVLDQSEACAVGENWAILHDYSFLGLKDFIRIHRTFHYSQSNVIVLYEVIRRIAMSYSPYYLCISLLILLSRIIIVLEVLNMFGDYV
jgi:hypothetical protein